jgi:hypothetical protein
MSIGFVKVKKKKKIIFKNWVNPNLIISKKNTFPPHTNLHNLGTFVVLLTIYQVWFSWTLLLFNVICIVFSFQSYLITYKNHMSSLTFIGLLTYGLFNVLLFWCYVCPSSFAHNRWNLNICCHASVWMFVS